MTILPRKEQILECATHFFATHGYKNTDIQEIANKLGIGKGTIYRLFQTKETLFFATVDRAMTTLETFVKESLLDTSTDIDRIKQAIYSYIRFFSLHPECIELFVQERAEFRRRDISTYLAHRARRDTEWREIFHRLALHQKVRNQNFDLMLDCITNLLYGIMFTDVFHKESFDPGKIKEGVDLLLYGIFIQEEGK